MLYDSGYFNHEGVDAMAFDDFYPEGHQGGISFIMNGKRVATNGLHVPCSCHNGPSAVVQRGKIHPEMPFPLYRDTSLLRHSFFLVLVNICLPSLTRTPSPSDKLVPEPRRKENVLKPCVVSWIVRCRAPSRAATQRKQPKTLRRGRYVKNIGQRVNYSLIL